VIAPATADVRLAWPRPRRRLLTAPSFARAARCWSRGHASLDVGAPATARNVAALAQDASKFSAPHRRSRIRRHRARPLRSRRHRAAHEARLRAAILARSPRRDRADRRDIDPVRFISNRSSGKMGFALAERAARRGRR